MPANYAALIAGWNSTVTVAGISSTCTNNPLSTALTTAQKMAAVNAWMVVSSGSIPMVIPTYQIYNVILSSDFSALSAANQALINTMLGLGTIDVSAGTRARANFSAIFTSSMATLNGLIALATAYDSPRSLWWQTSTANGGAGLPTPVSGGDLVAAGGLT